MGDNLETRIKQGFELNPTGETLINDYLIPWVTGQNPIWNGVVEKAIYGDSSPWEIFSDIESHWHSKMEEKGAIKYTIFAFASLVRVRNSKRFCRRAGRGNWGGQTGPKMIENSDTGCIIGQSKMLVYAQSGKADVGVGHWITHEFSLSEELVKKSGRANAADLVVCKITKIVKKKDKSDHNTNQSPAAIGYGDRNDAMAAQPESNGESCNLVGFAPDTNEGFFDGDYQVQCAQPESYCDGSNYERFAPDTYQSPAAIGYGDCNDAMAAQPESNGESCNLVRFAPETNEGIFNGDYQVQCAQPESYDDGSNYERFVPDTNEGLSEYIGNNGDYQVQAAQPESHVDGSYYARFAPDTNEFLFPANDVPYPGFDPFAQPNIVPTVQQSDERHAPLQPLEDANKFLLPAYDEVQFANPGLVSIDQPPIPVPASPTVSMKRAAEVDLQIRNGEDSDMKRQKCDGEEFSDDDWMKEFEDMFDSDFQQHGDSFFPLSTTTTLSLDDLDFDSDLHPGPTI